MAQVQLPLLVPADGGDGLVDLSFGLLYDDVSLVLLGVYGHNATDDDLYLKITLDTAPFRVFDITLGPDFPYTERIIPVAQRLSMRELPDDKGGTKLVPPITEFVKERRYANPRRSSPVVLSVTETQNATSSTTHNATMPATVDVSDGLATWIIFGQPAAGTVGTPAGWSKVGAEEAADDGLNFVTGQWFGKEADGSEDGVSVNFSTSASTAFIAQVYRIQAGTWSEDVTDWEANTPVVDFDGSIDPSNIVYSGGVGDHLYLVGAGTANDSVTSSGPAGWTGTSEDMNSTNDLHARSAHLVVTGDDNADPGAMTFDADSHIAIGIVVPETGGAAATASYRRFELAGFVLRVLEDGKTFRILEGTDPPPLWQSNIHTKQPPHRDGRGVPYRL